MVATRSKWGWCCLLWLLVCQCCWAADVSSQPNFVLIVIDDMGYADVGCYGGKRAPTPRIDQLAAEGMKFTDFHSAASVCSASRASILTGCYAHRLGIPGVLPDSATIGINSEETLISEILKERGYATAAFGKWHLGHHAKFLPTHHGFDEYHGLPFSNDMAPVGVRFGTNRPQLPLIEGDRTIALNPDQSQLTTTYTERAVAFIERNKDQPFFLYLPHSMVHVPLAVSEKFLGKSGSGLFGDVLMELDWSVGQVLDTLKRNKIDNRTLVVFTSDNGPWLPFGDHAGSAGPFRESKMSAFEGGFRVPFIARWPGKIPAGQTCDELATTMDFLPTFAKLAGADLPNDRKIDGKDIWPLLSSQPDAKSPYDVFYYYRTNNLSAIRSGPWKLVFPHQYVGMVGPPGKNGQSAGADMKSATLALYNLEDDVGETTDVASAHPEVVERLSGLAEQARDDLGDGLAGRTGRNLRPAGKL